MFSNVDLYNEILEKEKKWISSIQFLNSIYCNLELKPFYLQKRLEIEKQYNDTHNIILGEFIKIIDNIIDKIDYFNKQYLESSKVDIETLLPLFFTNQLNNSLSTKEIVVKEEKDIDLTKLDLLQIRKQIIQNSVNQYKRVSDKQIEENLYDDFDLEVDPKKK